MKTETEYMITRETCQQNIDKSNRVCSGCGGVIEPLETVDNAGNPTHWPGCLVCSCFDYGVSKQVFDAAYDLVANQNEWYYHHDAVPNKEDVAAYKYWVQSQCRGMTGMVLKVLTTFKKLEDAV